MQYRNPNDTHKCSYSVIQSVHLVPEPGKGDSGVVPGSDAGTTYKVTAGSNR
jgi:hypothetical protein